MPVVDLAGMVGREIGLSDWFELTPARIDRFDEVVGNPDRSRVSPFFLMSLLPSLLASLPLPLPTPRATINYGLDRLAVYHLPPAGSRIRARVVLAAVDEVGTGLRIKRLVVLEDEAGHKLVEIESLTQLVV